MWKRRLIAIVTFVAGLYYFLEFVVPATVPWGTTSGVVQSVSGKQVTLGLVRPTGTVSATDRIDGPVSAEYLKAGDRIRVVTSDGPVTGIVMSKTVSRINLGEVYKTKSVPIRGNTLILRKRATGAPEQIPLKDIAQGNWVSIGPSTYLSGAISGVNDFFIVLASFAWGMGLLSLWLVHSDNIKKRRTEWGLSIVFFVALAAGLLAGHGDGLVKGWTAAMNKTTFWYIIRPMSSTVFSLLTFYLASASYRAFKIRSGEGVLMMVSALIVMLGQIPIGLWLTQGLQNTALDCLQIPNVGQWILLVVNTAAVRGLYFGMMLGAIAVGLRFWLSLERGAFFDTEL